MLDQILKMVTPDQIIAAIKNNPTIMPLVLQRSEAYLALGKALTTNQQLIISNNLNKLAEFLGTDIAKDYIAIFAEDFCEFCAK